MSRTRPSNHEIRQALSDKAIVGHSADLLTEKFVAAFDRIEARGGISAISANIAAKIEAARERARV
jgi:hypothetical protein